MNADYTRTQKQGTIYITTQKSLLLNQRYELDCGAGELYLTGFNQNCTPEQIMNVASHLGEIFCLRFKVDFHGKCRGFAYLQYIDQTVAPVALKCLPRYFRQCGLVIAVKVSNNLRELIIRNALNLTPMEVKEKLLGLCMFDKLTIYEFGPHCSIYVIRFRNNEAATRAHLILRTSINIFGRFARIQWLHANHPMRCLHTIDPC